MNMKEKHFIIRRALSALTAALIACSCTLPLQASASGSQLELGDKFDQYISNAVRRYSGGCGVGPQGIPPE